MMNRRVIEASIAIYRRLLVLYPPGFRRAWGEEMTQVFATQCRRAGSTPELLRVWWSSQVDLWVNAVEEMLMVSNSQKKIWGTAVLFALVGGMIGAIAAFIPNAWVGDIGETLELFLTPLVIAGLAFAAGMLTTRLSKRVVTGLWVGLLVGVLAVLMASLAKLGYSFAFYDLVRSSPPEIHAWLAGGGGDFNLYLLLSSLVFFLRWAVLMLPICGVCGTAGGMVAVARRRAADRTADRSSTSG